MNLLCFAHRAEAEAFFVEKNFRPDQRLNNLYQESESGDFLLITGEGIFSSLQKVTSALSIEIEPSISTVINLGVAGALSSKFNKFDVVSVRTSYLCETSEALPQFRSFPTQQIKGLKPVDCMSSTQRIKDPQTKKHLSSFSEVIDRELWGIGYAAKEKKIPLVSIKVISDEETDVDFCQEVKENSFELSKKLLNTYKHYISNDFSETTNCLSEQIFQSPNFYLSTSQKRLVKKLVRNQGLKNKTIDDLISSIELSENKKSNSKQLIDHLEGLLSPELSAIRKNAKNITRNLQRSGIQISYDQSFETPNLKITTQIKNKKDLDNKVKALSNFSFSKWENFINGEL